MSFQNRKKKATAIFLGGEPCLYTELCTIEAVPTVPKTYQNALDGTEGTGPVAYGPVYVQGYILHLNLTHPVSSYFGVSALDIV